MRRIVSALALLATLSGCATTVTPAVQKPAREGLVGVYFESRPDQAELYIDGKLVGSTGMTFRLVPGVHTIEMKKEGFEAWRRELSVSADNPARLVAILVRS